MVPVEPAVVDDELDPVVGESVVVGANEVFDVSPVCVLGDVDVPDDVDDVVLADAVLEDVELASRFGLKRHPENSGLIRTTVCRFIISPWK